MKQPDRKRTAAYSRAQAAERLGVHPNTIMSWLDRGALASLSREDVEAFAAHISDPLAGLPDDLARVLRDHSIVVPQDAAVWELLAEWRNAPSNTASADLPEGTT